jgi:hypothetical protein
MFSRREMQEALRDDTVDKTLARVFCDQLIKHGFSFIFVLDGFDKVDILPKYQERFVKLSQRLLELLSLDTRLGGCYLAVMRSPTTLSLSSMLNSHATENNINLHYKNIYVAPYESIVETRLRFLEKYVPSQAVVKGWDISDWPNQLADFRSYLIKLSEKQDYHGFFDQMDSFYSTNHRVKVQLLQLIYHNFLRDRAFSKRYQLVESMCKAGFRFPPQPYQYSYVEGKLVASGVNKLFDNIFLPPIFRYPYSFSGAHPKNLPAAKNHLLMPLRTLQILQTVIQHHISTAPTHAVDSVDIFSFPISSLLNILKTLFGYREELIQLMLEEFSEFHIVELVGQSVIIPTRLTGYQINILPNINAFYDSNRKGVLKDVSYLNLCAMRALVSRRHLVNDHPYIKASSIDESDSIEDWIPTEILNVISLYRLIAKAASLENNKLQKNISKLPMSEKELLKYDHLNIYFEELRPLIIKEIENILRSMSDFGKYKLMQALDDYKTHWCQ